MLPVTGDPSPVRATAATCPGCRRRATTRGCTRATDGAPGPQPISELEAVGGCRVPAHPPVARSCAPHACDRGGLGWRSPHGRRRARARGAGQSPAGAERSASCCSPRGPRAPDDRGAQARARDGRPADRPPAPSPRGIALPGSRGRGGCRLRARPDAQPAATRDSGTVAGFVVVVIALTLAIALIPEIGPTSPVWGLPLSWLLQAYAFYPIILVFAVLYVRTAERNERAIGRSVGTANERRARPHRRRARHRRDPADRRLRACASRARRATSSSRRGRCGRTGTRRRSAASTSRPAPSSACPDWCCSTVPAASGSRSATRPATSWCSPSSPPRSDAAARTRSPTSSRRGWSRRRPGGSRASRCW
jgi:hypothetical protein